MASKYEPSLRELAMEPDEDKRLEMAAELDRDAAELDERWDNRDEYSRVEAERDEIAAERDEIAAERDNLIVERDNLIVERDEWKKRYADRFFDSGEGITDRREIIDNHAADVKKESRPRGFAALWDDRVN